MKLYSPQKALATARDLKTKPRYAHCYQKVTAAQLAFLIRNAVTVMDRPRYPFGYRRWVYAIEKNCFRTFYGRDMGAL